MMIMWSGLVLCVQQMLSRLPKTTTIAPTATGGTGLRRMDQRGLKSNDMDPSWFVGRQFENPNLSSTSSIITRAIMSATKKYEL